MKKILGVMAVAVLLIAGLMAPASADHPGPIPHSSEANQPSYWVAFGAEHGEDDWECSKTEPVADPYVLGNPPEGYVWRLLVVKGGAGDDANQLFWDPVPGPYSHGSAGNSHIIICKRPAPEEPPTHTVVFTKQWEGDEFDDSDVVVTFDVDVDGEVDTYDDGEVIEYEDDYELVGENVTGFPEGDCSWDQTNVAANSSTDQSGNTEATVTVTNTVECEEEDEPLTLTLVKAWDVTDEDDLWDEADASYTLLIDGVSFEGPVEVEDGQEIEISEDDVVVSDGCEFLGNDAGTYVVDAEDADEDGLITITVTNEVDCAAVLPTEPEEREPEEEPKVEETKVEKKVETEVLAETLPETGVSALLLSLLGLSAVGSGTAILRRRK